MTTPRQYVACRFSPGDKRSYTYHNDGPELVIGDKVVVDTPRGRKTTTVVGLPGGAPPFETKPVLGRPSVVPVPTQQSLL